MINDILLDYQKRAAQIPNWQNMNKNILLNDYVKYENSELHDAYLSAIICRYWSNIYKFHTKYSVYELDDYYCWYIDGIMKALKYRSWLDPKKKISKDKNGPDKIVNRCITTVIGNYYIMNGRAKRKINSAIDERLSLDALIYDNSNITLSDSNLILDKEDNTKLFCKELIQSYINKNKIVDAILLDHVCFQSDVDLKSKKLDMRALVKQIAHITDSYKQYFKSEYLNINESDFKAAIDFINNNTMPKKKNNKALYMYLTDLLESLKEIV